MKIIIKNLQKKVPICPARIKKSILRALEQEGPKKQGEITVSFVSDKLISKLNFKYLKKKQPTDVLAFNLTDKPNSKKMLADIVVSVDTALRNARIYKTSAAYELNLYSIHGLLHLLGYTDHTLKGKPLMRKKESKYAHP
ncbi:MAG: rRNA maturation RNase YbeY [Candidatus Omnitrophota bacterium]|nr:rRNA maturation RNase YbeY [Candidatus Omnitrophota bacterium]